MPAALASISTTPNTETPPPGGARFGMPSRILSIRRRTQPIGTAPWPLGLTQNTAQSAGDKVSALSAEISIATLIVTANCRTACPIPPDEGKRHEHGKQHQQGSRMIGP